MSWLAKEDSGRYASLVPYFPNMKKTELIQFSKKELLECVPQEWKSLAILLYKYLDQSMLYEDHPTSITFPKLVHVYSTENEILDYRKRLNSSEAIKSFLEAPVPLLNELKAITFADNDISDNYMQDFVSYLQSYPVLEYVDFSGNRFGQSAWRSLATLLENPTIIYVNIIGNNSLASSESLPYFEKMPLSQLKKLIWIKKRQLN